MVTTHWIRPFEARVYKVDAFSLASRSHAYDQREKQTKGYVVER